MSYVSCMTIAIYLRYCKNRLQVKRKRNTKKKKKNKKKNKKKKKKSKRTCDSRERIHFIYNERVKHEIKKQEDQFLGALLILLAASVVQPSELGEQEEDT